MEIYGADITGINGQLVKFSVVKETERRGVILLGLAQKVVREGYTRAVQAIETLKGEWDVKGQGYTIDLDPAETPKISSGLDLPIAIMLLQASILQNLEKLQEKIKSLQDIANSDRIKNREDKKRMLLEKIAQLIKQRENILKYQKRLTENRNRYLLIGKLNIVTGNIISPQYALIGMIAAARSGSIVIVPEDAEIHASLIASAKKDITAYIARNLQEVWDVILGITKPRVAHFKKEKIIEKRSVNYIPDLNAIEGVTKAKLAMEVALAGGHNILLVGPPGQGKTMLAHAALNLLPDLTHEELFEVNKIYSARGELSENMLILRRPYQEVTNITPVALFGGGQRPRPGLISAAHKGVLFFDEINMQSSLLIEELRKPLNDRVYRVQRANSPFIEFPSNFILIAAMNPCNCGWHKHFICPECKAIIFGAESRCFRHPDTILGPKCQCSEASISNYKRSLSKPLLDRIDLKVFVSPYDKPLSQQTRASTKTIKSRITRARKAQELRYKKYQFIYCNADIPDKSQFVKFENLKKDVDEYIEEKYKELKIDNLRTKVKLLLVSKTVADMEDSATIDKKDVNMAIDLMGLNHSYFRDL